VKGPLHADAYHDMGTPFQKDLKDPFFSLLIAKPLVKEQSQPNILGLMRFGFKLSLTPPSTHEATWSQSDL
jgi:hypothetical protein